MTPPATVPTATLAIWLRSWLYFFLFLGWTIFCGLAFLPLLLTPRSTLLAVHIWTGGVVRIARVVVGITYRVEGREHLPPGPCIIAAQHQASFETYKLFAEVSHPIFVLKRELMWIPAIGWYMMRAGFVGIDRGAGAGAMRKMLRGARQALEAGYQVVVFPEGTRVPPGETRPYQPGIAALYHYCSETPMIPMALNSGIFWGKTRILKLPGEIVFKFLPALPRGLEKEAMLKELRERLEAVKL